MKLNFIHHLKMEVINNEIIHYLFKIFPLINCINNTHLLWKGYAR